MLIHRLKLSSMQEPLFTATLQVFKRYIHRPLLSGERTFIVRRKKGVSGPLLSSEIGPACSRARMQVAGHLRECIGDLVRHCYLMLRPRLRL